MQTSINPAPCQYPATPIAKIRPQSVSVASLVEEIAAAHGLKRRGDKFAGKCPDCGGSSASDKFNIRLDGGYKCYSCDLKGDIITWLRTRSGMSCPDAHDLTGRPCRSSSCAVAGTCRHGNGSGAKVPAARHKPSAKPRTTTNTAATLAVSSTTTPEAQWQTWAEALVQKAAAALTSHIAALAYLAKRGIDLITASEQQLGWRYHDQQLDRAEIGLPPESGKTTLWVPGGLVIPTRNAAGNIQRLLIRRTPDDRKRFLPDLKYWFAKGGHDAPRVIGPHSGSTTRGAVIVEADLDAIAVAAAHTDIMAVALRTVKGGIPDALRAELATMPVILVALDADPGHDGKLGAGPQAIAAWTATFRQARFWPPPSGKDAGDYAAAGGDLNAWIESGLPPTSRIIPAKQDLAYIPESISAGGEGEKSIEKQATAGKHYIVRMPDGREVNVTDDKTIWQQLTNAGQIVFSEHEMQRLQAACHAMTANERAVMISVAIATKETFAGAYIKRGVEFHE